MKHSSNSYLTFIAYLQAIGIVLVVFGHSTFLYPDGEHGKTLLVYRMMYSFRMPLFIFVSGFLLMYTSMLSNFKKSPGEFVRNKTRRLLLPFLLLIALTYVPRCLMSSMATDNMELSWASFFKGFFYVDYMVIPYFWFLQTSFILLTSTYAILIFFKKISIRESFVYAFLVTLFFIFLLLPINFPEFLSLTEVKRLGLYFILGLIYGRFHDVIDRYVRWDSATVFITAAILWVSLFFLTESTPWIFLCSIAGIAMSLCLARILESRSIGVLNHLAGATYLIFLLSWFFNVLSQQFLSHFIEFPWWIYSVLSFLTGIYVPWAIYRYMLSHPKSPLSRFAVRFLGQSFRK